MGGLPTLGRALVAFGVVQSLMGKRSQTYLILIAAMVVATILMRHSAKHTVKEPAPQTFGPAITSQP